MSHELARKSVDIDMQAFNLAATAAELLPRGHVIHGYSSVANERVIKVLQGRQYSDEALMLGYGVDGRAERALARALLTYAMRERDGLYRINATQYTESAEAQVPGGGHNSRFDNIVWVGDFTLYQEGDLVIASSSYGGGYERSLLEVSAPDALGAIVALAGAYQFMNDRMDDLPAISLE